MDGLKNKFNQEKKVENQAKTHPVATLLQLRFGNTATLSLILHFAAAALMLCDSHHNFRNNFYYQAIQAVS